MRKLLIILILVNFKTLGQDFAIKLKSISKEPGVVNYQLQVSRDSLGTYTTFATIQPTKLKDSNVYNYVILPSILPNFYRIKILYTNTTQYTKPQKVINTNVIITNAYLKFKSYSDNLSWTASNYLQVSYFNIERNINGNSTWSLVGKLLKNNTGKYVLNITKYGSQRQYRLITFYVNGIKSLPVNFINISE